MFSVKETWWKDEENTWARGRLIAWAMPSVDVLSPCSSIGCVDLDCILVGLRMGK